MTHAADAQTILNAASARMHPLHAPCSVSLIWGRVRYVYSERGGSNSAVAPVVASVVLTFTRPSHEARGIGARSTITIRSTHHDLNHTGPWRTAAREPTEDPRPPRMPNGRCALGPPSPRGPPQHRQIGSICPYVVARSCRVSGKPLPPSSLPVRAGVRGTLRHYARNC
jgi:hypothetical protein